MQYNLMYCNTIFFFYSPFHTSSYFLTIHSFSSNTIFFFSQYNLGSSPKTASALHFFFLRSSHWKIQKNYTPIFLFFHFPEYSNKFIKIYFFQFSSVLHCKTLEKSFSSPHKIFFPSFPVASFLLHTCSGLNTAIPTLKNFMSSL